jgi:hypothetical protein
MNARGLTYLKWFTILYNICAVAVVVISHSMIAWKWPSISNVAPLDVRSTLNVVLVLAPGAIGALVHYVLERRLKEAEAKAGASRTSLGNDR